MIDTNDEHNEEQINYAHNLRKNRKARNYNFDFLDVSLNSVHYYRYRRRKKKNLKKKITNLPDNLNSSFININDYGETGIIKKRGRHRRRKNELLKKVNASTESTFIEHTEDANRTNETSFVVVRNRKKYNTLDRNLELLNTDVLLKTSNNVNLEKVRDYLNSKTKLKWMYMGSLVKMKLKNNQQEKYIFLKNMKRHIIFEIIKIAVFALLKINLNENNMYSLNDLGLKKMGNLKFLENRKKEQENLETEKENEEHDATDNNTNDMDHKKEELEKVECDNKKESTSIDSELLNSEMLDMNDTSSSCSSFSSVSSSSCSVSNVNLRPRRSRSCSNFTYDENVDTQQTILRRLDKRNDVLNQGVTVTEILNFVKEKYERYYENVKQYIVNTLNVYCALNIMKLIRRGKYAICKFNNIEIFNTKNYRKYHKYFYTLKGEEEVLMNIRNYIKSFYHKSPQRKKNNGQRNGLDEMLLENNKLKPQKGRRRLKKKESTEIDEENNIEKDFVISRKRRKKRRRLIKLIEDADNINDKMIEENINGNEQNHINENENNVNIKEQGSININMNMNENKNINIKEEELIKNNINEHNNINNNNNLITNIKRNNTSCENSFIMCTRSSVRSTSKEQEITETEISKTNEGVENEQKIKEENEECKSIQEYPVNQINIEANGNTDFPIIQKRGRKKKVMHDFIKYEETINDTQETEKRKRVGRKRKKRNSDIIPYDDVLLDRWEYEGGPQNTNLERIKCVNVDINKIKIKCVKILYGIKHYFCAYDTKRKSDESFETIKIKEKYSNFNKKNMYKLNLRNTPARVSHELNRLHSTYSIEDSINNNGNNMNSTNHNTTSNMNYVNSGSMNNHLLVSEHNLSEDELTLHSLKKLHILNNSDEEDSEKENTANAKYKYIHFNVSYKSLRKKMILLRSLSNIKREENLVNTKEESKTKNNINAVSSGFTHSYSMNSEFLKLLNKPIVPLNFEKQCSQRSI